VAPSPRSVAIVLAAGDGRRLGGPKALASLGGRSFLAHVIETCRLGSLDEIIVVTGAEGERVEAELAALDDGGAGLPLRSVRHDSWELGRTGSLQAGWRAAGEPAVDALLFPVDHPLVTIEALDTLLGVSGYCAGTASALIPVIQGEDGAGRLRGHPVLLGAQLRDAVLALEPDQPLNEFLRAQETVEVPVDDEGILLNVNDQDDLSRAETVLRDR
jgi:CTP:molybdopterin cytidylyltransferase MocA